MIHLISYIYFLGVGYFIGQIGPVSYKGMSFTSLMGLIILALLWPISMFFVYK